MPTENLLISRKRSSDVDIEQLLASLTKPICPFCQRMVSNKGNLRRHIELHVHPRRFQCDICFKKYARKDYVIEHKIMVHSVQAVRRQTRSFID